MNSKHPAAPDPESEPAPGELPFPQSGARDECGDQDPHEEGFEPL